MHPAGSSEHQKLKLTKISELSDTPSHRKELSVDADIRKTKMQFFGKTDTGIVRDNNQDCFFAGYLNIENCEETVFLAAVCDGMGGANGGNIASNLAIETFVEKVILGMNRLVAENLPTDDCETVLSFAISCANTAVYEKSREITELYGMGTTIVAMLQFRDTVYIANVGDSGLFCITGDEINKLTRDHSYVQTLVDKGEITEKEAREHPNKNVIMRAIGTDEQVRPDFFKIYPDKKIFLLCSDGLSGYVEESQMLSAVVHSQRPDTAVRKLVELANKAGGGDNITAIIVKN